MVIALVRKYRGETTSSNKAITCTLLAEVSLRWNISLSLRKSVFFQLNGWHPELRCQDFLLPQKDFKRLLDFLCKNCASYICTTFASDLVGTQLCFRELVWAADSSDLPVPQCCTSGRGHWYHGVWEIQILKSVRISYINKPKITGILQQKNTNIWNMIYIVYDFLFLWNKPAIFTITISGNRTSRPWPVPRTMPWRWSLRASVAPWICDASRRCNENWTMPSMTWASAPLCVWTISHPRTTKNKI